MGTAPLVTDLSAVGFGGGGSYSFGYNCAPKDPYSRFTTKCTYSNIGNYTAGAQVTDADGSTATCSALVTVGLTGGSIDGVCGKTHYSCVSGSSIQNGSYPSKWTWVCTGQDGGKDASCSEKKGPGFIEN